MFINPVKLILVVIYFEGKYCKNFFLIFEDSLTFSRIMELHDHTKYWQSVYEGNWHIFVCSLDSIIEYIVYI